MTEVDAEGEVSQTEKETARLASLPYRRADKRDGRARARRGEHILSLELHGNEGVVIERKPGKALKLLWVSICPFEYLTLS